MKPFLTCLILLSVTQVWALDENAIRQNIADLSNADPKVRAAAIKVLTPLYTDLYASLLSLQTDTNPEVAASLAKMYEQLELKMKTFQEKVLGQPFILKSRLEANETAAAANCKAYAEGQEIYHRTDWDADGVLEYAQAFKGDSSLLDKKSGDRIVSIIDEALAAAGDGPAGGKPKAGYYFKILTKQGANAQGGAKDYVVNGNMTLGYALIAYPAVYGETGKHCFMINHKGFIYKRDLGPDTLKIVEKMDEFNPDKGWTPVE